MKLAFGCGHIDYRKDGYKNVDKRKLDHVDYVTDVGQKLPFDTDSIDEIRADSVLEHLHHNTFGVPDNFRMSNSIAVLREWRRVLKVDGKLWLRVPCLDGVCKSHADGKISSVDLIGYLYGGGEYPENYHLAGFDVAIMKSCLRAAGFKNFKITAPHDENSGIEEYSWEMGVVAIK